MQVRDVMTRGVECISLDASLPEAAERMRVRDVGSLPVVDGDSVGVRWVRRMTHEGSRHRSCRSERSGISFRGLRVGRRRRSARLFATWTAWVLG